MKDGHIEVTGMLRLEDWEGSGEAERILVDDDLLTDIIMKACEMSHDDISFAYRPAPVAHIRLIMDIKVNSEKPGATQQPTQPEP